MYAIRSYYAGFAVPRGPVQVNQRPEKVPGLALGGTVPEVRVEGEEVVAVPDLRPPAIVAVEREEIAQLAVERRAGVAEVEGSYNFV